MKNTKVKYSFAEWCMDNNHQDWLDGWDDELNKIDPADVAFQSNQYYYFKCPDCGHVKHIQVYNVVNYGFRCNVCSDGNSYPNKFMREFLLQLGKIHSFDVLPEHVFSWSRDISEECSRRIYDFVITTDFTVIIEVNGKQHYDNGFGDFTGGRTLDDELNNDKFKKALAIQNGILDKHYIVIDARNSDPEWIKQSIVNSNLREIYQFTEDDINWMRCNEVACKNAIRVVCDLYMSGITSVMDLSRQTGYCKKTIHKYLKLGAHNGWCDYSEQYRYCSIMRPIKCIESEYVFASITECSKMGQKLFGKKINAGNLQSHLNGKRKSCGGLHFIDITKEYFMDIQRKNPTMAFGMLH